MVFKFTSVDEFLNESSSASHVLGAALYTELSKHPIQWHTKGDYEVIGTWVSRRAGLLHSGETTDFSLVELKHPHKSIGTRRLYAEDDVVRIASKDSDAGFSTTVDVFMDMNFGTLFSDVYHVSMQEFLGGLARTPHSKKLVDNFFESDNYGHEGSQSLINSSIESVCDEFGIDSITLGAAVEFEINAASVQMPMFWQNIFAMKEGTPLCVCNNTAHNCSGFKVKMFMAHGGRWSKELPLNSRDSDIQNFVEYFFPRLVVSYDWAEYWEGVYDELTA